ncbi:MAG TPA: hypothetical protein H9761_14865 [Candidatus Eisenbergiella merdavium]|uniref:DUF669 domain-containing protein n=1 Tax=Candidatus Eisenbergiella merdavium TaxID=2838551 RepID=A0A9D2SS84_9FIRM|nr:hypothetical protein [Candidatus Eisenbergiella merdavium]
MSEERELQWDDTIENDGQEYVTLPEGDYAFTVESFERGRHNGSEKLPACNKAIVRLRIDTPEGPAFISHQLFLHTKTEGLLSAFFSSLGLKKKGEPLRMNWNAVTGASGRAHITLDPDRNDPEKKYNHVKRFYPKDDGSKTWKAGNF